MAEPDALPLLGASNDTDVAERLGLWERLNRLSPQQRAVIVLRFYEDLSDADIATALEVSPGNVRVIAHRALAALRQQSDPESKISEKKLRRSATFPPAVKS